MKIHIYKDEEAFRSSRKLVRQWVVLLYEIGIPVDVFGLSKKKMGVRNINIKE